MHEFTVKVKRVDNGYRIELDEEGQEFVFQETDDDEVDAFVAFLRLLDDTIGPMGGKYSEKRVYISALPGLDHPNYERAVKERFYI